MFKYLNKFDLFFVVVCYLLLNIFSSVSLANNNFLANDSGVVQKSTFTQTGIASLYGAKFHNKKTASGERFNMHAYTAAHPFLEFGTEVKVTNLNNSKSVTVRINDRGPFVKGRIIDLSQAAAKELDFIRQGITKVKIETVAEPTPKNSKQKNLNIAKNESKPLTREILPQKKDVNVNEKLSFSVQVGAFGNPNNAENLRKSLIKKNFKDVNILQVIDQEIELYKVFVGNFPTYEEATNHKEKLLKNNIDGFIIRNN